MTQKLQKASAPNLRTSILKIRLDNIKASKCIHGMSESEMSRMVTLTQKANLV